MKLFFNDRMYIQRKDADFILHELSDYPEKLKEELIQKNNIFFVSSLEDSQSFDCVFEDPDNIAWLRAQKWLDDFEKCYGLTCFALDVKSRDLNNQRIRKIARFNDHSRTYRMANYDAKYVEFKKMKHKIDGLVELREYLEGAMKFTFPEGYDVTERLE